MKKESPTVTVNIQIPRRLVEEMKRIRESRSRKEGRQVRLGQLFSEAVQLMVASQESL